MRLLFTTLFFIVSTTCLSQPNDNLKKQTDKKRGIVSFVTKLDTANLTKDGIYLNGYVVNISHEQAKKLNGKNIRVTGRVTIVKGLKNTPKKYDEKGNEIMRQGREEDTKHIESPNIEIIKA